MRPLSPTHVQADDPPVVVPVPGPAGDASASAAESPAPVAQPLGVSGVREMDASEIPPTDILFECPKCGKSLSIEPRGAGLVIRCTQCGEPVTVPIPEGMEIEDVDATQEELAAQLQRVRRSLESAQARIAELESEVTLLREFRATAVAEDETRTAAVAAFRLDLVHALREQESALAHLREAAALSADFVAAPAPATDSGAAAAP